MDNLPKNIESVSIRIDFFSKPMFNNTFIERLNDTMFNKLKFYNRLMTDEEKQRIDIDDVAQNLSISIEEIVCKKVYSYIGTTEDDLNVETYISDYFICMFFEKINEHNFSSIKNISNEVFDRIKASENEINAQLFSYRVYSHLQANDEFIDSVINHNYIKIPDNDGFTNARYADLFALENERINLNLIRDIFKGKLNDSDDIIYDILISAIANKHLDNDNISDVDFNQLMNAMESLSFEKIGECYN